MKNAAQATSDDKSERADRPGTLTVKRNNPKAAMLLIEALADREQDDVRFRWRNGKKSSLMEVKFATYHDAAVVRDFINNNMKP